MGSVEKVPQGKYKRDESGNIAFGPDGQRVIDKAFDPAVAPHTYELVSDNKIVSAGLPAKDTDSLIKTYTTEKSWVSGQYKRNALAEIEKEFSGPPLQKQGDTPTPQEDRFAPEVPGSTAEAVSKQDVAAPNPVAFSNISKVPLLTKSGTINLVNNPKAYDVAQLGLGIGKPELEDIKPALKSIFEIALTPATSNVRKFFVGDEQADQLDAAKKKIVNYLTGKEFDSTPAIKNKYTQAVVDEHNKNVAALEARISGASYTGFSPSMFSGTSLDNMITVGTPKELYTLQRSGFYNASLDILLEKYRAHVHLSRMALSNLNTTSGALLAVK